MSEEELTPEDKERLRIMEIKQTPPLTNIQTLHAMKELNNNDFVQKFPKVDRVYADPAITLQVYGLISFIPAKGATPNEKGIYGFAKLRGNYQTEAEANERAEFLIRNVDSQHQIFHAHVGAPFPLTNKSDYSKVTEQIEIKKDITTNISADLKEKRKQDEEVMHEIKQREEKLLEESKQENVDPYDQYITLRVKKAQLSWTYLEHQKKMAEVKEIIIKTREELEVMDQEYPEYIKTYFDKYMSARKEAGLQDTPEEADKNFIKFLVEDADLGF